MGKEFRDVNGEQVYTNNDIEIVDGRGALVLWGNDQDLNITQKKDGDGCLILHRFRNIKIKEKNGSGSLVIANDNKGSVTISEVNGSGVIILYNDSDKIITKKSGPGSIVYKGKTPIINELHDQGELIHESDHL
jgi:hypothetical protein